MNPYADLFTLFERSGVKDRQSLETLLGRFPSGYYPSPGQIADDPALLCDSFCCRLMDRSTFCDEVRIAGGIRQFSLNVRPRIPDDSVRKGLFLSSIATIFTSHELTYRMASYQNYYDGSSSVSFSWDLDLDFVRDVYEYRDLLQAGLLRILPRACKRVEIDETVDGSGGHSYSDESTVSLLEEIETTRVFHVPPDDHVLDAIVAKYKQNHQLISLPPLYVPWIDNVSMANILKLKRDYDIPLADFQRAYHDALLAYIENHRTVDFATISEEICRDVISPQLNKLDSAYRRILSYHRSMTAVGAIVATIPLSCAVLSCVLFKEWLSNYTSSLLPATLASLVAALAMNRLNRNRAIQALEDNAFFVLWNIGRSLQGKQAN